MAGPADRAGSKSPHPPPPENPYTAASSPGARERESPHPPTPFPAHRERGSNGRLILSGAAALTLLGLASCGPEAARIRGGGEGADIGNRGSPVVLLEETYDQRVYFETPDDLPPISGPAGPIPTLEPATPLPPSFATPVGATPGPAPFGSPPAVPDAATPVGSPPAVPPAATGGTTDATPGITTFASPAASPGT